MANRVPEGQRERRDERERERERRRKIMRALRMQMVYAVMSSDDTTSDASVNWQINYNP